MGASWELATAWLPGPGVCKSELRQAVLALDNNSQRFGISQQRCQERLTSFPNVSAPQLSSPRGFFFGLGFGRRPIHRYSGYDPTLDILRPHLQDAIDEAKQAIDRALEELPAKVA